MAKSSWCVCVLEGPQYDTLSHILVLKPGIEPETAIQLNVKSLVETKVNKPKYKLCPILGFYASVHPQQRSSSMLSRHTCNKVPFYAVQVYKPKIAQISFTPRRKA
jgi:hypothetical protein